MPIQSIKNADRERSREIGKAFKSRTELLAKVGGKKFAIVCIDTAKYRSEWRMADYFGNAIILAQTLKHQAAFFKIAFALIREAQAKHHIEDLIVSVERTGTTISYRNAHLLSGLFRLVTRVSW